MQISSVLTILAVVSAVAGQKRIIAAKDKDADCRGDHGPYHQYNEGVCNTCYDTDRAMLVREATAGCKSESGGPILALTFIQA
jgi:hypothetical protein